MNDYKGSNSSLRPLNSVFLNHTALGYLSDAGLRHLSILKRSYGPYGVRATATLVFGCYAGFPLVVADENRMGFPGVNNRSNSGSIASSEKEKLSASSGYTNFHTETARSFNFYLYSEANAHGMACGSVFNSWLSGYPVCPDRNLPSTGILWQKAAPDEAWRCHSNSQIMPGLLWC